MSEYIYLADIADWTLRHPDALSRLPDGYIWTWVGSDGAWCGPA